MFSLVVVHDNHRGIGICDDNGPCVGFIPFKNSADRSYFRQLTLNSTIVMGRRTWESFKGKPLVGRTSVVISRSLKEECSEQGSLYDNVFSSVDDFLVSTKKDQKYFIIGGVGIYREFIERKLIFKIYLTKVNGDYKCNVKMDPLPLEQFYVVDSEISEFLQNQMNGLDRATTWTHRVYRYINTEETKILDIFRDILDSGVDREDRTNIGTKSVFGRFLEFDLSHSTFPLITSRRLGLKGIFEELMLFLRGQTDSTILEKKGINVWKPNTTRDFLDRRGLQRYKEGSMGPCYGHAFRYFGSKYIDSDTDYTGQGYDQLNEAIRLIKTDPHSRRIIINLWNPAVLDECAVPPCLFCYQFYVEGNSLSCLMNQRSSDIGLAGGWNIGTGSLLTFMLARITGLKPKSLKWSIGDVHIYKNQFKQIEEQIRRVPKNFPKLYFSQTAPSPFNEGTIEQFEYEDLILVGYRPETFIPIVLNSG